jgi:sigma-B regulation protein RsbU (phosphoserine phosphatase)
MPLGVEPHEEYPQVEFQLEAGDTLLLTTDGITEARAPKTEARRGNQFLDAEGLMRLAVAGSRCTLSEMADTILSGAQDFSGGRLRDDAALILVRRSPVSPDIKKNRSNP